MFAKAESYRLYSMHAQVTQTCEIHAQLCQWTTKFELWPSTTSTSTFWCLCDLATVTGTNIMQSSMKMIIRKTFKPLAYKFNVLPQINASKWSIKLKDVSQPHLWRRVICDCITISLKTFLMLCLPYLSCSIFYNLGQCNSLHVANLIMCNTDNLEYFFWAVITLI